LKDGYQTEKKTVYAHEKEENRTVRLLIIKSHSVFLWDLFLRLSLQDLAGNAGKNQKYLKRKRHHTSFVFHCYWEATETSKCNRKALDDFTRIIVSVS